MKNTTSLFIVIICVSMALCSCGRNAKKISTKEIKGKYCDTEFFTMFIADGFAEMAINGGIQAYKGLDFIEIHVRGLNQNEADVIASINILAKNYQGSPPDKVDLFGMSFHHSSIMAQGVPQDVFLTVKNGKKVSITLSGKNHDKDENLKAMFGSIKFKS